MIRTQFVLSLILLVVGCTYQGRALLPGDEVTGEIHRGASQGIRVQIPNGSVAHLLIHQFESDLSVEVDGTWVDSTEFDWESVYVKGDGSGVAQVRLRAAADGPAKGRYVLRVVKVEPRTERIDAAVSAQRREAEGREQLQARTAATHPAAERLLLEAARLWAVAGDPRREGQALLSTGVAVERQTRYVEADRYYLRGIERIAKSGDENALLRARKTWANLGGRFGERRMSAIEAEANLARAVGTGERRSMALWRSAAASAHADNGDFEQSEKHYTEYLRIARELGDRHLEGIAYHKLGGVAVQRRHLDVALGYSERARDIAQANGDAGEEISILGQIGRIYQGLHRPDAHVRILEEIRKLQLRRGDITAWFGATSALAEAYIESGDPRSVVDVVQDARRQLVTFDGSARAPSEYFQLPGEMDLVMQATRLNRFHGNYGPVSFEIVDSLRSRFWGRSAERRVADLQKALPPDTILLEFVEDHYASVWVVRNGGIAYFRGQEPAPARTEVKTLIAQLEDPRGDEAATRNLRAKLSRAYLGPLRGHLGARNLVIVSDEELARLPYALLPDPDFQDGSMLGDHHTVTYAPSGQAVASRTYPSKREGGGSVVIAGDPVTSARDARFASISSRTGGGATLSREEMALPRLAFAGQEIEEIAAAIGGERVTVLTGFDATRRRVLQEMARARFVHLVAHGVVDFATPRASGIAFSLWDRDGQRQEGMVRFDEIAERQVQAELITLSACDSAVGNVRGHNGVPSMANAFLRAGARRVVSTLWKIDDAATSALMASFYRHLFAESRMLPGEALWRAQMEVRAQRRWRNPYYWAGFALSGEWRGL